MSKNYFSSGKINPSIINLMVLMESADLVSFCYQMDLISDPLVRLLVDHISKIEDQRLDAELARKNAIFREEDEFRDEAIDLAQSALFDAEECPICNSYKIMEDLIFNIENIKSVTGLKFSQRRINSGKKSGPKGKYEVAIIGALKSSGVALSRSALINEVSKVDNGCSNNRNAISNAIKSALKKRVVVEKADGYLLLKSGL